LTFIQAKEDSLLYLFHNLVDYILRSSFRKSLLFFISLLLAHTIYGQAIFEIDKDTITRFERINVDKGLSSNEVTCFHQDNYGFIWVGTQNGLNIYNGIEFKIFRNEFGNQQSLPSDYIYKIFETKDSLIWICTEFGLSKFDRASERFINFFPDSIELFSSKNKILEIYEVDDFLVLNVDYLLYTFNKKTCKFQSYDKKLLPRVNEFIELNSMIPDSNGTIWIFEDENDELVLNHFDLLKQKIHTYRSSDSLKIKPSLLKNAKVYKSISGIIWLCTFGNGVYKLSLDGEDSFKSQNYTGWEGDRINSNYVLDIFEDSKSNIWFGGK